MAQQDPNTAAGRAAQPPAGAPQSQAGGAQAEAAVDPAQAGPGVSNGGASADGGFADQERLRAEAAEANDLALRTQAELDNYRKRARRELDDERKYANLPLLRDLLPVLDNIQRAIAAAQKSPEGSSLLEGIKMVAQNLQAALARHQCVKIEALHKPFDPTYHEAISQQPSEEFPPHTVLLVAQDGYMVHDRVVRPAQVIVSTAPA